MGRNKIDIPIIKAGKDICRFIFTKDESMQGRYDLKIDFRKNIYEVWTYRMFARCPIIWDIENTENTSITYHHGDNNRPIIIHLKNENPNVEKKYQTLPANRIQPPNVNTMFPIPLCKIEIPKEIAQKAQIYKRKSYHHSIDMEEMNVLEMFMVSDDFEFSESNRKKYAQIFECQARLSMEYYATYTVLSDYEKSVNFMPRNGIPEKREMIIGGLKGMKIVVNMFSVSEIDRFWDKVHVTFIENELAEDMLLCTLLKHTGVNWVSSEYKRFCGSANLKQLQPPTLPLSKIPVLKESVAEWTLKNKCLSEKEADSLEIRAGRARCNLYIELKKHEDYIKEQREYYVKQAYLFREALGFLRQESVGNANVKDNICYMNEKQAWLATDWCVHTCELHMLFARFMGISDYIIWLQSIRHKDYVEDGKKFTRGRDGIIYGIAKKITSENTVFRHAWLNIDDYFEIDLVRDALDIFFRDGSGEKQKPVTVSRSRLYAKNDPWNGMRTRLENKGFICEPIKFKIFNKKDIERFFQSKNGLYEDIYNDIMENIKK